jgi:hypothetical protein
MLTRTRQNGISFWGLLVVAAVSIFFLLMFFKLLPSYIEHAKVKTALEGIAHQPDASTMEKSQIKTSFERRFNIDDVHDIDLNKDLFVEKKPGVMTIRVTYERRVPLFYNVTALINFSDNAQVNTR